MDFPLGPVVRLCAPTIGGMGSILRALVRELRSCMLHGMAKKNPKKQSVGLLGYSCSEYLWTSSSRTIGRIYLEAPQRSTNFKLSLVLNQETKCKNSAYQTLLRKAAVCKFQLSPQQMTDNTDNIHHVTLLTDNPRSSNQVFIWI